MLVNLSTASRHMNIISFQPYLDWRLWVLFFAVSILFLYLSHKMERGNEVYMVLAVLFGAAALIGSLSVADFTGPTTMGIDWINTTYMQDIVIKGQVVTSLGNASASDYIYTRNIYDLSSIWMTSLMFVYWIICVLNMIYVYVEIVVKRRITLPTEEQITRERIFKYGEAGEKLARK